MSEETRSKVLKPTENGISGKVVRQNGMVTVTISSRLNFGDIAISVQTQDEPDENVYGRAQKAIDFIKENMKEKENQYYG